jgi:riboflavin transporter FmnP
MPVEAIVEMGTKINPNINSLWDLILLANVPFNLLKGVLSGVITFLIYKRLSPILHK